jgi:hypothetical protein
MHTRGVAVLAVMTALVGCSKDSVNGGSKTTADVPAEMAPHPAKSDVANVAVPKLFASIPQDTPYLLAGLEPVSLDYYAKLKTAIAPLISRAVANARTELGGNAMFEAIVHELDGKWTEAGIESLGLSAKPRFAIYGLGLQPVVMRLEVKSHKVLQATIERVAAAGGKALPTMETKDGRSFWKVTKDEHTLVVALADNLLIAAFGKTVDVDAKLGLILGADRPPQNMADGKAVKELMVRHGFGPQLVGYADSKRITTLALAADGRALPPPCTGEIDRLTTMVPRLALGYGELSTRRLSGGFVFEASPELRAKLAAVKTTVPGMAAALAEPSVMAIGIGADLAAGQKLGGFIADNVQQLATACALDHAFEESGKMGRSLAKPLPEPFGKILGVVVSLQQLDLDAQGQPDPTKIAGFAVVGSSDAKALFNMALQLERSFAQLGITADGKLHDIPAGTLPLPLAISAAVADKMIVVTAGDQGKLHGAKVLAAPAGGKSPLLVASYDYAKLTQLQAKILGAKGTGAEDFAEMFKGLDNAFGRATAIVDVTDQGLSFWTTLELK